MSPLLKITSLQWEGRDAYNFYISNCVVSLHADRLCFHFYGKPYIYYDIEIMALE